MKKVSVVDYGVGNLRSVAMALEYCGAEVNFVKKPAAILSADRVILPGVGAFPAVIRLLREKGFEEAVKKFAESERPFLGICVGMQMLFDVGMEFVQTDGLGLIPGSIQPIPDTTSNGIPHRIPHIGWSGITAPENVSHWRGTILDGLQEGATVYFVHSFTAHPVSANHLLAETHYDGRRISAVVRKDNVYGTQFHPEKSGETGLAIINNFLAL